MLKTKAQNLPNGNRINYGQLLIARNGSPKRTTIPQPAWGMKSQTRPGGTHPFLHGQALSDETADKLSQNGRTVPVHSGMGSKDNEHRGADYGPGEGSRILAGAPSLEKHGEARFPSKK